MDLGDITQLTFVATTALILGRLGWSLARLIDRRSSSQGLAGDTAGRLHALEEEQAMLRQDSASFRNARISPSVPWCASAIS